MHPSPSTLSSPKRNDSKNRFPRELGLALPGLHKVTTGVGALGTSSPSPFWTGWGLRRAAPRERPAGSPSRVVSEPGQDYESVGSWRSVPEALTVTASRDLWSPRHPLRTAAGVPVAPVSLGYVVRYSSSTTGASFIEVGVEPLVD